MAYIKDKKLFFLILLISIRIYFFSPIMAFDCNFLGSYLYEDCSNGYSDLYIDNARNHPDSCCLINIYENFCEGANSCSGNNEHYCLQIKKDSAKDYKNFILENTKLKANLITITCRGEEVYSWKNSSSYIKTIILLYLLFLLLLF